MTNDSKWRDVVVDANAWVADAIQSGDLDVTDEDGVDRWISETADGCEHVIWYDNAWSLYRDGDCPVAEDDVPGYADVASITDRLTAYAYEAVTQALRDAVASLS